MTVVTDGETDVRVTRHVVVPPEAGFRAHPDPALIRRWMLGPEGWGRRAGAGLHQRAAPRRAHAV